VNCKVLVDAAYLPRWKQQAIELLRARHRVELCRTGEAGPRNALRAAARFLGGRSLRRAPFPSATAAAAPDVVIDLRDRAMQPAETPARYGYWFFCEGDGSALSELPGAAEIASGSPTFTIELRNRERGGRFSVLRRGRFKSLYAYSRSMDLALRECTRWPAICLDVVAATGKPDGAPAVAPRAAQPVPFLRLGLQLLRAFLTQTYTYLFVDARWQVGLVRGSPASFLSKEYRPNVEWLAHEACEFLADPFVVHLNGRPFIMGEALDASTRTGFISGLSVRDDGSVASARTIMRAPTHLSYPYVFQADGQWYLVPESAAESRITLYRALEFPYAWEPAATLVEGVAACDGTILQHGGAWWLLFTDRSRDANLNLFAYYADDLLGPWNPHTANPVKTDIRSARPAGKPFIWNGDLYRPGQDCAESYGSSISFNRITRLTPHEYREEEVAVFGRGDVPGLDGSHTISYSNGIVAIDSKTNVIAGPRLIGRRLGSIAARMIRATCAS
jgi:hypothetical protein